MAAYSDFVVRISASLTGFDANMAKARRSVQTMASDMQGAGVAIAASITAPLVALGAASLKSFGEIDSLKKALGSLEGSAAGAERRFRELQEVAKLPGLGIREAVQADLTLRNFGRTAEQAKIEVMAFGNALAAAGRGKADLTETIRQFGQLTSAAKLTQENLTPIIERVPQVAGILRKEFGPTGGTAEGLRNLGVTTEQASAVIIRGLQGIPPVASGFKNSMENMSESVQIALAAIGEGLAPTAERISNEFVVPAIEKIKQLAAAFKALDPQVQNTILILGGIAAALGPAIYVLGSLATSLGSIAAVAARVSLGGLGIASLVGATTVAGIWATADAIGTLGKRYQEIGTDGGTRAWDGAGKTVKAMTAAINSADTAALEMKRDFEAASKITVKGLNEAKVAAHGLGDAEEKLTGHHKALSFESKSLGNSLLMIRQGLRVQEYEAAKLELAKLQNRIEDAGGAAAYMAKTFTDLVSGSEKLNDSLSESRPLWDVIPDKAETMGYALERIAESMAAEAIDRVTAAAKLFKAEADFMARIAKDGQRLAASNQKWFDANAKKVSEDATRASAAMARHIERHWHQIADAITKAGFSAKNLTKAFADMGRELLRSLASAVIEAQLKRLTGLVMDLAKSSGALGKALGAVFNTGGAPTSARTPGFNPAAAVQTGAQAVGAAGQAGGAVAGAAGGGATAIVGAVGAVVGAVSSIVGNFQMRAMNKTLDLIENYTRYAKAYLLQLVQEIQQWLPKLNDIHLRLMQVVDTGVGVYNQPGDQGIRIVAAGGSIAVNSTKLDSIVESTAFMAAGTAVAAKSAPVEAKADVPADATEDSRASLIRLGLDQAKADVPADATEDSRASLIRLGLDQLAQKFPGLRLQIPTVGKIQASIDASTAALANWRRNSPTVEKIQASIDASTAALEAKADVPADATGDSRASLIRLGLDQLAQKFPGLRLQIPTVEKIQDSIDAGTAALAAFKAGASRGEIALSFSNCSFGAGTTQSDIDKFMRAAVERLRLGGQI